MYMTLRYVVNKFKVFLVATNFLMATNLTWCFRIRESHQIDVLSLLVSLCELKQSKISCETHHFVFKTNCSNFILGFICISTNIQNKVCVLSSAPQLLHSATMVCQWCTSCFCSPCRCCRTRALSP